jgi:hypothetical protein
MGISSSTDQLLIRIVKVDPIQFRVGDIVEAQIMVAVVPIHGNRFKMVLHLRTITLLDGTFTDVSHVISDHAQIHVIHYTNNITAGYYRMLKGQ